MLLVGRWDLLGPHWHLVDVTEVLELGLKLNVSFVHIKRFPDEVVDGLSKEMGLGDRIWSLRYLLLKPPALSFGSFFLFEWFLFYAFQYASYAA